MKYLKRIIIGLFVFIVLLAGSVFIILALNKERITGMLISSLKTNYGLVLKVEDIDVSFFDNWPHASAKLKDIYLSTDTTGQSNPLLKAGSVSLSFNLAKLLQKQFSVRSVSIKDAEVNLIRFADGTKNFKFKSRGDSSANSSGAISFAIDKITISGSKLDFRNLERNQHINIQFVDNTIRLKHYTDGLDIDLSGKVLFGELLFKAEKGAFLKNKRANLKLAMNYFKTDKTLCIHPPSTISIEDQLYGITTLLDLKDDKKLALYIDGRDLRYEKTARLLTPNMQRVLSNFAVKKTFDANVLLVTTIDKKQEPILIANIEGRNSDLTIGKSQIPYSGIFFKGKIISLDSGRQCGNSSEAKIIFSPVTGKVYDFPFTASIRVVNFDEPYISMDADLLVEASKLKTGIGKEFILDGSCTAKMTYEGPTKKLNKNEFLDREMKLNATVSFNNVGYREMVRPYKYVVNGKAIVNNTDLKFENLRLKTDAGEVILKGRAEGFVNYVLGYNNSLKANVAAKAESLDLNPFLIKTVSTTSATTKKTTGAYKEKLKQSSQSRFEFTISLAAKKLLIRKVEATNATMDVFYRTDFLNIRSAGMNACGGRINAKCTVEEFSRVNSEVSLQDVNVTTMFEQFENFGQKVVTQNNLKGTMYVDAKFRAELDEKMEVKGETMAGEVKLKLKDGHLVNFEPVQSMSNFIFRNRDFNDVTFSELDENFKIKGYEMQIEELEIASNVLNLFVANGSIYNFKGNSNINVLVPWSNLKRRGKNYIPKISGESAENTRGLKLNFSGPSDKMKISLGHKGG